MHHGRSAQAASAWEHRPDERPHKHVLVVGGGFSGAIFAHHLLRESPCPVIVEVAEDRALLGAGVAYSASDPHQTTNVPTARMSAIEEDPSHFERWFTARVGVDNEVDHYPNRAAFGLYMDHLLRATEPANPASCLLHRRTRVTCLAREPDGLAAHMEDGSMGRADAVGLATGNPVPAPPPSLALLATDPRVVLNPWSPGALDRIGPNDRALIVGTGLSMGEAVAGLRAMGHVGGIVAIARRGRRPERGSVQGPPLFGDFQSNRVTTARGLVRHFRREVGRAEAAGLTWRSVAASARVRGWELWADLEGNEKHRFVRHVRPFWEALRHVMPGRVHDRLAEEEQAGTLQVLTASLHALDADRDGLHATLRPRGRGREALKRERFDVVLNCAGPAYATLTQTDPFWTALARSGLVQADGIGLRIAVDRTGRACDGGGTPQSDLLALGTLGRGTFGELTGVPELSRQARKAARGLVLSWTDVSHHDARLSSKLTEAMNG